MKEEAYAFSLINFEKIGVFKANLILQFYRINLKQLLNILAWDYRIRLEIGDRERLSVCRFSIVMINRSNCGYLYLRVRGEIFGSLKDKLKRKRLPKMFSLTKS